MTKHILPIVAGVVLGLTASATTAATLDDVQARGEVICGVSQGLPGFSNPDDQGNWSGIDVDFCRAVAAAIFDDPNAVSFTPLSA